MTDSFVIDSFAEAWREGYAAGGRGMVAGSNPHPDGVELALDWHDGWREGTRDRERPATAHEGVSSPPADRTDDRIAGRASNSPTGAQGWPWRARHDA